MINLFQGDGRADRCKTYLVVLLCIIITSLLLLYALEFDLQNIINGGDTTLPLDPDIFSLRGLFTWSDSQTGLPWPITGWAFTYTAPLWILEILFRDFGVASFLYYVAFFSLPLISSYLLWKQVTDNQLLSIWGCLFYSFNLLTALTFHSPIFHLLSSFGLLPLGVLVFREAYLAFITGKSGRLARYLLGYCVIFILLSRAPNMAVLYFVLIPILGFWSVAEHRPSRLTIQLIFAFLASAFVGIALLPILIPTGANYMYSEGWTHPTQQRFIENTLYVSRFRLDLLKVFRLITSFGWKNTEERVGILAYNFADEYQQSPLLVLLSFYPIVMLVVLWLVAYRRLHKQHKLKLVLITVVFLTVLFLTKVLAPPLSTLSQRIYNFSLVQLALRSGAKWLGVILIFVLALELVWLLHKLKPSSKLMAIMFGVHLIYIVPALLLFAKPINEAWVAQVPGDYYQVAATINDNPSTARVVAVPFTQHQAGYVEYTWGYGGPDPIYTLLNQPILDKFQNLVMPDEYVSLIDGVRNDYSLLSRFLHLTGVRYVIHRKDIVDSLSGNTVPDDNFSEALLDNGLHLVTSSPSLDLYEVGNASTTPLIYPVTDVIVVENVAQSLTTYPLGLREIDSPREIIISRKDWCSKTSLSQPNALILTFSSSRSLGVQLCNDLEGEYTLALEGDHHTYPLTMTIGGTSSSQITHSLVLSPQSSDSYSIWLPQDSENLNLWMPEAVNLIRLVDENHPFWFEKCCPVSREDPLVYAHAEFIEVSGADRSSVRLEARNACSCIDFALSRNTGIISDTLLVNLAAEYSEGSSGQQLVEIRLESGEIYESILPRHNTGMTAYTLQVPQDSTDGPELIRFSLRNRISGNTATTVLHNPTVYQRPFEYATFRAESNVNSRVPYLEFTRINPTLYHVRVRNATDPYLLTFLNSFNRGWKAYLVEPLVSTDDWRATTFFFDGTVGEGRRTNRFLAPDYLRTWRIDPLPESSHLTVNGYANGWWIERTGDYDIIIEFIPQRGLYVGSAASLLFLTIMIPVLPYLSRRVQNHLQR